MHGIGGGAVRGLTTKISIFSRVHEISQTFYMFTLKTNNFRWDGGYQFSRQVMTFPGLLICDTLKFPLRPPGVARSFCLCSKPFPDVSECAWIYIQNITDLTKQLKHYFPPANIPNVSQVGLLQRTERFASRERSRGYFPPADWLQFITLLS